MQEDFLLLRFSLTPLASSQPHRLSVLLQLRNKCISLLDDVVVLLVLVVRAICLDDALHAVNRAGNPISGNEFRQVPSLRELAVQYFRS
jgi:hypothetical protein